MADKKENQKSEKVYSKQQILQSSHYPQKDVLQALLRDDQKYTHDQVKELLDSFLEKEAK